MFFLCVLPHIRGDSVCVVKDGRVLRLFDGNYLGRRVGIVDVKHETEAHNRDVCSDKLGTDDLHDPVQ